MSDTASDTTSNTGFPLQGWLGFEIDSGEGAAIARLTVGEHHMNPHGVVHGAVMFALLDTAMGGATMSVLDEGSWCATVDITTRFLAPCFAGDLVATATVRKRGRRVVHLDAVVADGQGTEYVAATGVFAVLPAAR
ncbi:MAG: PaaI family thioesterase [Desertimonas sp.]